MFELQIRHSVHREYPLRGSYVLGELTKVTMWQSCDAHILAGLAGQFAATGLAGAS